MIPESIELRTERLLLRAPTVDDAPACARYAQDLECAKNTLTMPHPYTLQHAEEFLGRGADARAKGTGVLWLLDLVGVGVIGSMGLNLAVEHHHAELGYVLGKAWWGRGYATEAGRAIVRFGFEVLELQRINAAYYARNPASGRVLQKLGLKEEGRRPHMYLRFGEWVDVVYVGLLRSDWEHTPGVRR